jgi:hypothetical protein
MTRTDEFIGQLEDYLDDYEGSTPLPETVRDAIRAELPSTQQRPAWWPARRFPEMNNMAKLGIAAAAVVVAALLGYSYFLAPSVGGPGIDDQSPTPTPTPPELSSTTGEPGTYLLNTEAEPPGTYHLPEGATLTIPAGWGGMTGYQVGKNVNESNPVAFTGVWFWIWDDDFDTVYLDACRWGEGAIEPPVGPTVDDLANALASQAQHGDGVPVDVTLDGHSGKMIEMTLATDIDFADCYAGEVRSWSGRYHQGPGQVDQVYILDVEGQRVVIWTNYMPGTSDAERAERQAIVDSIQLGGP